MNWRRTRAVLRKELIHIVRDPRSLVMALAFPFLLLLLFSYALSLDVDRIPTIVFDQDRSPGSRALLADFQGSPYFSIAGAAATYADIERSFDRGDTYLAVVIPPGFRRVQLLLDGSDSNTASLAQNYATTVVAAFAARRAQRPVPIEPRVRVWYNSAMKSRNFIIPGLVAVILQIIAALLTSLTVAREWETGTMEQLLSTPLRPAELIFGKLGAFYLLGVADAIIATVAAIFIFDVPFRGEVWFLAFATALFLFGALSWGLFISSVATTQVLAFQMGLLSSFLPAFLLSGFIYAIENMPAPIQVVSTIVPAKYFVAVLKSVYLKGLGLQALWWEVLLLAAYAAAVALLAIKRLRTKVA